MLEDLSQLRHRNVQRFQGGLAFKAHRLLYHSTLGLRVIKKRTSAETMCLILQYSPQRSQCVSKALSRANV